MKNCNRIDRRGKGIRMSAPRVVIKVCEWVGVMRTVVVDVGMSYQSRYFREQSSRKPMDCLACRP